MWFYAYSTSICVDNSLTQLSVIEREVSQVCRVLGQGEETPGQTVPHEVAPRGVPQHPVLDDLHKNRSKEDSSVCFCEFVNSTLKCSQHSLVSVSHRVRDNKSQTLFMEQSTCTTTVDRQ